MAHTVHSDSLFSNNYGLPLVSGKQVYSSIKKSYFSLKGYEKYRNLLFSISALLIKYLYNFDKEKLVN
jgi:hypothetical protein